MNKVRMLLVAAFAAATVAIGALAAAPSAAAYPAGCVWVAYGLNQDHWILLCP